jgi:hypothetical protein
MAKFEGDNMSYRVDYFDWHEMQGDKALVRSTVVPIAASAQEARVIVEQPDRTVVDSYYHNGGDLPAEPKRKTYVAVEKLLGDEKAVALMEALESYKSGPNSPATKAVVASNVIPPVTVDIPMPEGAAIPKQKLEEAEPPTQKLYDIAQVEELVARAKPFVEHDMLYFTCRESKLYDALKPFMTEEELHPSTCRGIEQEDEYGDEEYDDEEEESEADPLVLDEDMWIEQQPSHSRKAWGVLVGVTVFSRHLLRSWIRPE